MAATTCPRCGAPVSARAIACAMCDAVLRSDAAVATALASANRRRSGIGGRLLRGAVILALVAAGLVGALGIGIAVMAARAWSRTGDEMRPGVERLVARQRAHWRATEAAIARSAGVAGRTTAPDLAAARALLAAGLADERRVDRTVPAALDVDTTAVARYGMIANDSRPSGTRVLRLLRDSAPARLDDSVRVALAADTTLAWLAPWRAVAASSELPRAWMYRAGMPGVRTIIEAPEYPAGTFNAIAWGNAAAALLALDAGDRTTAERRARENLAVAYAQLRGPTLMMHLLGRIRAGEAATLLRHVGRAGGDTALVAEAASLRAMLDSLRGEEKGPYLFAALRTPDAAARRALVADTLLPPGMRIDVALASVVASCGSARELLLGPASRRREELASSAALLRDLDREERVLPMLAREFDGYAAIVGEIGSGRESLGTDDIAPAALFRRLGLDGLAGRLVVCNLR